jgi:hypothetical protein
MDNESSFGTELDDSSSEPSAKRSTAIGIGIVVAVLLVLLVAFFVRAQSARPFPESQMHATPSSVPVTGRSREAPASTFRDVRRK